ncbi:hypothetical protein [Kribbella antiqua]|nr:hypothetical protein [Kribbella antiqua]
MRGRMCLAGDDQARSFGLVESRADWILNMVVDTDAANFVLDLEPHTPG